MPSLWAPSSRRRITAWISSPHLGVFALNAAQVGLGGEAGVMLLVGYPLTRLLPEKAFFRELIEKCK